MKRPNTNYDTNARLRWISGALLFLALVVTAIWWMGRNQYPEVTSPESLTLVRALYTACSSQNEDRLQKVQQEVTRTHEAGKLTQQELESFQEIIARARAGRWEEAARASYRFAQDQVR